MAWMGMRPVETSWPPERRSADGDGRRPAVLPDEHGGDGARLERGGGLFQVVLAEQAGGRALEIGEAVALLRELAEVDRRHRPVLGP